MIITQIQQSTPNTKKAVLSGLVRFIDLIGRVRYNYKKDKDEIHTSDHIEYQRRVDESRLNEISRFIEQSIICSNKGITAPIFPTSIILAADNEWINFDDAFPGKLIEMQEIPQGTLIVDGQHRFFGMLKLYNKAKEERSLFNETSSEIVNYLDNYYFNCTILVNYDLWEQAQVFASVNFNQKKVNKSLFYDIYGINLPNNNYITIPKQNEIYIAHQLVKHLDSSEKSPFKGFVRMLGKGKGFISQAFLVECFMKLLSENGIWADTVSILKETGKLNNFAANELTAYLAAIRFTFIDYWPEDTMAKPSLLCKTTGIGAVMQFLPDIHNALSEKTLENIKDNYSVMAYAALINEMYTLIKPLAPFGKEFFAITDDSKYVGGAGKGMQAKLYNDIYSRWKELL